METGAGVQYIIDTVVEQCQLNPDRKFTYVEQAFFHRWWTEQPPHMQEVKETFLIFLYSDACKHLQPLKPCPRVESTFPIRSLLTELGLFVQTRTQDFMESVFGRWFAG
jgi:hypothetical protein